MRRSVLFLLLFSLPFLMQCEKKEEIITKPKSLVEKKKEIEIKKPTCKTSGINSMNWRENRDQEKEDAKNPNILTKKEKDRIFRNVMDAIEKENYDKLLELLSHPNYTDNKDWFDSFLLFQANENNNLYMVKFLLEKGINPKARYQNGRILLTFASMKGNLEIMEYLFSISEYTCEELSEAMVWASFSCKLDALKFLVDNGADVNKFSTQRDLPLYAVMQKGHERCFDFLLEIGADTNKLRPENIEYQGMFPGKPILTAAAKGNLRALKILYKRGADIQIDDELGYTALHVAAKSNRVDVVQYLIDQGLDINAKNHKGQTPLYLALYFNAKEAEDALRKYEHLMPENERNWKLDPNRFDVGGE